MLSHFTDEEQPKLFLSQFELPSGTAVLGAAVFPLAFMEQNRHLRKQFPKAAVTLLTRMCSMLTTHCFHNHT